MFRAHLLIRGHSLANIARAVHVAPPHLRLVVLGERRASVRLVEALRRILGDDVLAFLSLTEHEPAPHCSTDIHEAAADMHQTMSARMGILPEHLARRVRTSATLLIDLAAGVPTAPTTVFGVVSSFASGAPEAEFPADVAIMLSFLAGELAGMAAALRTQVPMLLLAAGLEKETIGDDDALAHAFSMERVSARSGDQAGEE